MDHLIIMKLSRLRSLSSPRSLSALRSVKSGSPLLRNGSSYLLPAHGGVRPFSSGHRTPPISWGVHIVPQEMAFVVERLGKYHRTMLSGIHFSIPIVDRIAYVHSLKIHNFNVADQPTVTVDNLRISVNGIIYLKIEDPRLASYEYEHPFDFAIGVAKKAIRSAFQKLTTVNEIRNINDEIVRVVNAEAKSCGFKCVRFSEDITDTEPTPVANSDERQSADTEPAPVIPSVERQSDRSLALNNDRHTDFEHYYSLSVFSFP